MMAKAFPNSHFVGYDFHPGSIEAARAHANSHGVLENARFEVGMAEDYLATGLDLVTFFDCLHDMGDPAGAAAHVRRSLKSDGSWMIVEPMAGDGLEQKSEPSQPAVLRRFDDDLCSPLAVAGGRNGARGTGRRGKAARGHHSRWLH